MHQHQVSSATGEAEGVESQSMEVFHSDGATELFLALEDTNWCKALDVIQSKPEEAKIWVISTGTVESPFDWSLWRRLPLHEACRRQAPAWLVAALISAYPEATEQTTQFGKLPLHVAVESGSPPEVVNLLVITFWHGITATDQSGRTPVEMLQESEMLATEDHKVMFESLERSQQTYQSMLQKHADEIKCIQERHAAGLGAIRQQHDEDLQQEQEQHEKLLAEVEGLSHAVEQAKIKERQHEEHIQELSQVSTSQKVTMSQMDEQLKAITASDTQKSSVIFSLKQSLAQKDERITILQSQVQELQGDLQRLASWQQDVLARQINRTEESMQTVVEQFVGMVDMLSGHGQRMSKLLKSRNIAPPTPGKSEPRTPRNKHRSNSLSDEKKTNHEGAAILDEKTLNHIAAAASTALLME